MTDTWRMKMSQRAMSIDNISFLSPPMAQPVQYEYETEADAGDFGKENFEQSEIIKSTTAETDQTRFSPDEHDDEENNIIPWKKLLRKTNSRLNLIS